MPDSLRDLLHRRAAEGFADADLTAGALKRARAIGRRRTAAVALGAVVGITAASVAAASLIEPNQPEHAPPATTTTDPVEEPTNEVTEDISIDEREGREPDGGICGVPDLPEWDGWGESEASTTLEQLPETLYFRDNWDDRVFVAVTGTAAEVVLEDGSGKHVLAPDGFRYARASMCGSEIRTFGHQGDGVGPIDLGGHFCTPSWSPDSNRLIAWSEGSEDSTGFIIDVASGAAVTEVSGEVPCDAMWTGDGEQLTWIGGDSLIKYAGPDGSAVSTGASLSEWFTEGQGILGLSGVSAGMTHICMEEGDPEYASSGHWTPLYCDRYIDLATQEEQQLPVSGERNQVVFLPDGSMIVVAAQGQSLTAYLVDAAGDVVDQRDIPESISRDGLLVAWFTD
jgi:hypothetical protein